MGDHYVVQQDDEAVRWSEKKLRRKLRENDLSGLELCRREGDDVWRPLHDLPLFGEEVPHGGDPREAARRRVARDYGLHLLVFGLAVSMVFGVVSIVTAIWGLFVLGHTLRALPPTAAWLRDQVRGLGGARSTALPPAANGTPAALAAADAGVTADIAAVRAMIEREPDLVGALGDELDRMATSIAALDRRTVELDALLESDDPDALARQHQQAQRALERADDPEDRALRERQVAVITERVVAEQRASRTLERLRLRRSLAAQQIRQLRLDLVRAEADAVVPDNLDRRLEEIRLEAEAAEEVDRILAR